MTLPSARGPLSPRRRIAILRSRFAEQDRSEIPMDARELRAYLAGIDEHLEGDARLVIYESAAFILLGETGRTSLDIGVAGPYSTVS